jgi:hypothetical protein
VQHTSRRVARVSVVALLAVLWPAVACHHGPQKPTKPVPPVVVSFGNESLKQADLFAVLMSGQAVRIGTIASGRTETLVMPPGVVGNGTSVNFVARLLASSRTPRSDLVSLRPGQHISITLPPSENTLVVLPGEQ